MAKKQHLELLTFRAKKVEAELVREGRNKKVVVFKYKSKTRYRIKTGHRQQFTEVKITKV